MTKEIKLELTRDELTDVSILVKRRILDLEREDIGKEKEKIEAQMKNFQHGLEQLIIKEKELQKFSEIVDKIKASQI